MHGDSLNIDIFYKEAIKPIYFRNAPGGSGPGGENWLEIEVKDSRIGGNVWKLCVHKWVKIRELKDWLRPGFEQIEEEERNSIQFRLYWNGTPMSEEKTLEYCRTPNGAVVSLRFRDQPAPRDLLRDKFSGQRENSHLLLRDDFNQTFTIENVDLLTDTLGSLAKKICQLKSWHPKDMTIFSEFLN